MTAPFSLVYTVQIQVVGLCFHCCNDFIGYFSPCHIYFSVCFFAAFILDSCFNVDYLVFFPSCQVLWNLSSSSLSLRYFSHNFPNWYASISAPIFFRGWSTVHNNVAFMFALLDNILYDFSICFCNCFDIHYQISYPHSRSI